jgi:hypothetical protein
MRRALQVAQRVETLIKFDSGPRLVIDVVRDAVTLEYSLGENDAAEMSESIVESVVAELLASETARLDNGYACGYAFSSVGNHLIQGSAHSDPAYSAPEIDARRARAFVPAWLDYMKALKHPEFETLCRGVLTALGCETAHVTARAADQGIDFYGRLSLEATGVSRPALPSIHRQLNVWLAGQAKHTPNSRIGTDEVRHIVGSVALARGGVLARGGETLAGFAPRVADPIYILLMSTGEFSRDARDLARKAGVIALDGFQLATYLCDNAVGFDEDGQFSEDLAATWILSSAVV